MVMAGSNHAARIERLRDKMAAQSIDVVVVTQNVDLYYFSGTMQTGFLVIPIDGEPVFYVRRSVVRAQEEASVLVEELGSLRTLGDRLREAYPALFADGREPLFATPYDVLPVQLFQRLQDGIAGVKWTDGSLPVRETRMIKSPDELAHIRAAARVADLALEKAAAHVRPGMAEFELLAMVELTLRLNGHGGTMRMRGYNQETITGVVAAGAAAAKPTYFDGPAGGEGLGPAVPQSAGRRPIGRGEPVLLDIGCCIDGYVIDQTRTLVIGELPDDLARAYEVSEAIIRDAERALKPGTICEDMYARALELAKEAGLSQHFMGFGRDQVKFLGHGIGLEIDELPVLARGFRYPLEPGMVVAVEPKFTFPGRGVVGIENSYLITADGFEKLTNSREGLIRVAE
nr:Xaa-Pro peptidase family protein [Paenibacillus cymbidii]